MASVDRSLTNKLRLKVNEAKSAVARPEERNSGFSISIDGSEGRAAPKALDKFKGRIRDMTRRTRGVSKQLSKELKPYTVGWGGYFGFCQTPQVLTISKRGSADDYGCIFGGSGRMDQIASRNSAAAACLSSTRRSPLARRPDSGMSGHPAVQQALRNHVFNSLGLPRLYVTAHA